MVLLGAAAGFVIAVGLFRISFTRDNEEAPGAVFFSASCLDCVDSTWHAHKHSSRLASLAALGWIGPR